MAADCLMGALSFSVRLFASRAEQAQAVSDWLAGHALRAVADNEYAILAVAGGNTPRAAYRALANRDLPWQDIGFMPTDERCVPSDSPRSNGLMLRQTLGAQANLLPLCEGAAPPPLNAVLLGVGEDGHIASLFPDTFTAEDDGTVQRVAPENAPEERVTLPLSALAAAPYALMMLNGKSKWRVLSAPPPPLAAFLSRRPAGADVYYAD